MDDRMTPQLQQALEDPQLSCVPLERGGNSRTLLVTSPRHGALLAKRYPDDGRPRLATEFASLSFLWDKGLPVARPIYACPEEGYAVYGKLPGQPLPRQEGRLQLLEPLHDFLWRLHSFRRERDHFAPAPDACLSVHGALKVLDRRRQRFEPVEDTELQQFLQREFDPLAAEIDADYRVLCSQDLPLPLEGQTLSPSDFGLHNALYNEDGQLYFVDFEFFGRDDPAKLVSDFLWHPAMNLSDEFRAGFIQSCREIYGTAAIERAGQQHRLHGLKWVLLLLNEFLPEDWERRHLAGESRSQSARQKNQLEKARVMLNRVREKGCDDEF